jgi:hypothetical protein
MWDRQSILIFFSSIRCRESEEDIVSLPRGDLVKAYPRG